MRRTNPDSLSLQLASKMLSEKDTVLKANSRYYFNTQCTESGAHIGLQHITQDTYICFVHGNQ